MSGLTASISQLFKGAELDNLNRSVSKLHDAVTNSYKQLEALEKQEMEVAKLEKAVQLWMPGPFGTSIPTVAGIKLLEAKKAIKDGYTALTGFDYLARILVLIFEPNIPKMKDVYSGIDGVVRALKGWNETWLKRVMPKYGQGAMWDAIQNEHSRLDAATGVKPGDWDNPLYLQTAQKAVANVTKLPMQETSGMGDFGITALIAVIVACVTLIAVVVGVVSLAKQFNVVANNVHEQRMAYEKRMEDQRKEYMAKRAAEGASVEQATTEWQQLKAGEDKKQQKVEEEMKDMPSALDLGKYLVPAAAVTAGILVLPKIIEAVA